MGLMWWRKAPTPEPEPQGVSYEELQAAFMAMRYTDQVCAGCGRYFRGGDVQLKSGLMRSHVNCFWALANTDLIDVAEA